jgi:thiol-disulfide isomerase/thioredoxin
MNREARTGIAILLISLICPCLALAQIEIQKDQSLQVGKPCPDFVFNQVEYYFKEKVTLKDFRGKWLILDCWNSHCMACITSFPHVSEMQKEFEGKVQFLLIGYTGSLYNYEGKSDYSHIKVMYNRLMTKENLELAIVYDSLIFKQFDIGACPYIIIIDDQGIVRGLTTRLTSENLNELLEGKDPVLDKPYSPSQISKKESMYDRNTPLLIHGNLGNETDYLYRSVLTKWEENEPTESTTYFHRNKNLVQFLCMSVFDLYQVAYGDTIPPRPEMGKPTAYGKNWYGPVLEIKDSTVFITNWNKKTGYYNYSLCVPTGKINTLDLQKIMQRDLMSYFGYSVKVEKRIMPCWNLVVNEDSKEGLKTERGPYALKGDFVNGFSLQNAPVSMLIFALEAMNKTNIPYIDRTGIIGNIDLNLSSGTYFQEDSREELRQNGFELIKDSTMMNVIVIRDPVSQN